MKTCKFVLISILFCGAQLLPSVGTAAENTESLKATDLRCEQLVNPLGIDDAQPRLSWKLASTSNSPRGRMQSAFRILVASEPSLLEQDQGDLWDSGQRASDQSQLVAYEGIRLESQMQCWWKIRVWDEQGKPTDWSPIAHWSMGLLTPESWKQAKWIGLEQADHTVDQSVDVTAAHWVWYPEGNAAADAPIATRYFRRRITLPTDRQVVRAICSFAGDDEISLYVNGTLIGTGRGHPVLVSETLTDLQPGVNELAVAATNRKADVPANPAGWIAAIRVEFDRGEPLLIYSDADWKSALSVPDDWQATDFNEKTWLPAMELGGASMAPWGIPAVRRGESEHRRLAGLYLRREFQSSEGKTIRRASATICGLGFFDLYLNGQLIGDQLMNPGLTGYDQRALYVTFDVTDSVRAGTNAIGTVLSNGRFFAPRLADPMPMFSYGQPRMIGQIHVEYSDGSEQTIVSDESWRVTAEGPLRASNEFDGEEYDARMEMTGWSMSHFDDSDWQAAQFVDPPGGELEAQMVEPIRITEVLNPVQLVEPKPGVWMVDFGQAFYGVVQLKVSGAPGTRVKLHTSYNVLPDGTLNFVNDRSARNTDIYTLKGEGVETWHPRFRGNATRWVQVEGFPGTPTKENFAGLVTHTDHEAVGQFACSNELINKVYLNARWGTRMQNRSVPMEPDRDERMPWSGHPAKTSESEGWAFNVARFYEHFLHNYRAHQQADGSLQEILPPYWQFNGKDIIWPSVATIIPDWYYNFYGDARPLRDNFEMMKRFVLYHEQSNLKPDATMDHCTYGDWVDTASMGANSRNFGATSRPLMATSYLYHNCRIVQRAAKLLGKTEDERYFQELADRIYTGFNRRFFDLKTATYDSATQCSNVLPLAFGLVPAEHRKQVIDNLISDILVTHQGHTSVGLIGMQWQMQVLSDIGRADVAYQIATRTERPSWGYMIEHGATTSWERWDTDTQDGGMNGESQKILSGNFEAWCYQTLGGINYDPDQPGFKHIELSPHPVGDLTWVKSSHVSPYGKIVSDWELANGMIHWHVVVPANTTATAHIPSTLPEQVRESDQTLDQAPGVQSVVTNETGVIAQLGSGTYEFRAPFQIR